MKNYHVYILTNLNKTTLYIGITNNLKRRLYEHRQESKGFVKIYKTYFLLYWERFDMPSMAIKREKQLKKWSRKKKESLINTTNASWRFLNEEVC